MDAALPITAATEAADSRFPSRADKISAMVSWLIEYQEEWYGPRIQWNKKQRDDFDAKSGFLMLFIDGFRFTKENGKDQATRQGHASNTQRVE